MRFLKIFVIAILALLPIEGMADVSKFFGVELQNTFHKDLNKKLTLMHHVNIITGIRPHEHVGLEIGSYISDNHKMTDYILHKKAIHANVVGYYALTNEVRARFGGGASKLFARTNDAIIGKKNHTTFMPRAFVGLEMDLCDNFIGRANFIWEQSSLLEESHRAFKNDSLHLNVGLIYTL